jgi:hypothetical protein
VTVLWLEYDLGNVDWSILSTFENGVFGFAVLAWESLDCGTRRWRLLLCATSANTTPSFDKLASFPMFTSTSLVGVTARLAL